MTRRPTVVAAAVAVAVGVSGCGSGGKPSAHDSASATPYITVPSAVTLTKPGTELDLAEPATVGWQPRQGTVAALEVTVDRIERTTFDKSFQGWQISSSLAATTPYFARATVTNVSDADLGGLSVQLYGQDDSGTLVAAQPFDKRVFTPCHPDKLPTAFAPGATTHLCFVYLISPGHDLASVAFQPQDTAQPAQALSPITWSGAISTKVKPPAEPKASKSAKATSKKSQKASS